MKVFEIESTGGGGLMVRWAVRATDIASALKKLTKYLDNPDILLVGASGVKEVVEVAVCVRKGHGAAQEGVN